MMVPIRRQQILRLIRGLCGILFDGGFHPPDPPGLKDFWSRAAGAGYVIALPERHSPNPLPVEAPWVPCSRPVTLKIAGCDLDDSLDHPPLSMNTLFQDGETLGNL